jgi:exodeoxyribonuclease-5
MRLSAGFDWRAPLPVGGEKIICLKNDNAKGLINGMFVDLRNPDIPIIGGQMSEHQFDADLWDEDGKQIAKEIGRKPSPQPVYRGHFEDHVEYDDRRSDRDWRVKKSLVELTFGWCITGHKSQGSQWPNIVVWDDHFGRTSEQRAQWLYTAITRAESGLVILE